MSALATVTAQFRHVTFPAEFERRRKVINFAAPGTVWGRAVVPDSALPEEQAAFLAWLFSQAGLDARAYRSETLQRRFPSCLRSFRARSVGEVRRLLDQSPGRIQEALNAMLVGVTSFFRDPTVFEILEQEVLPALMKGRAGLHVWSTGCSDGAELYSLGILFAERGWLAGSYLLGTDCRPDAIRHARAGFFEPLACKNVKPELLERYLPNDGDRRRAVAALRNALRWRVADLLQVQEPGVWDLIICRNTIMYLRADAANLLWPKFESLLRPGGVLVLGKAERPIGTKRLTPAGPCRYRRTRG